jgi:phosphatidylserine/phosphatidylglycerophosphate/cardiolipin synthase-like enzyme/uncharacterized membrane protein YdjX (TVP38/TMEM64 family)
LVDGGNYFGAVRAALLKARSRVFILGWDIHSRTPLVGPSGKADDGYPEAFGDFLSALVRERRRLRVHVLLWDYAVLYATERELFPTYALRWTTPPGVNFSLDDAVPIGSSAHQKIIVVDDCVAFSGGLDITIRRWDTSAHAVHNASRCDPNGKAYGPFHDVQAIVDGDAARALARLARARWSCACAERIPLLRNGAAKDPWPEEVVPDFRDVPVAIARTQPEYETQKEVREVEASLLATIGEAERAIYIENQFLSAMPVARALAQRLRQRPDLEVLMVAPANHKAWLEAHTLRNGRIRFMAALRDRDIAQRVRLLYPRVQDGDATASVMVHSKVTIIDDKYLRIGSANLNNRSMGTDTECDLIFEARTKAHRAAVVEIRNRLLSEHCGHSAAEMAAELARNGSMLVLSDRLAANGRRLCPIDDGEPDASEFAHYLENVADPERPIHAEDFVSEIFGGVVPRRRARTLIGAIVVGLLIIVLALAWEFTPLAEFVHPKALGATLKSFADGPFAPLAVALAFVAGGLILFPVTVLIAATAATFGPWLGFVYAAVGTMLSALLTYTIGAWVGRKSLRDFLGPKLNRVRRRIARKGVLAVATIRMVPLAPFSVVNLVAGASSITLTQFILGTLIGMLPGIFMMSVLGHQISQIFLHPDAMSLALLAGAVAAWIGISVGIQAVVSKFGERDY